MPDDRKTSSHLEVAGAFSRNFTAVIAALVLIGGIAWFWMGPRVTEWAQRELGMDAVAATLTVIQQVQREQQNTIATISQTQSKTADTLNAVVDRIASLEKAQRDDRVAPIVFVDDSLRVTSGKIGNFVRFDFMYTKLRDCGRPVSDAFFTDADGISHAFKDKSSNSDDGRSISAPISSVPVSGRFLARIPADQGVKPTTGAQFARAYFLLSWPDCPNVPALRSPTAPFQVFPE